MRKPEKQRDAEDPARSEREAVWGLKKTLSEGWKQLRERIPLTLKALGLLVFILALLLIALFISLAHAEDGWQDASAVLVNLATMTILLIGGAWAFYVLVIGRSFSGSINIEVEAEQVASLAGREGLREALITVRATNAGKTRVDVAHRHCYISLKTVREDELANLPLSKPISSRFEAKERDLSVPLFERILALEPAQETVESVLITIAEPSVALKITAIFQGSVGPMPLPEEWLAEEITDWRRDMLRTLNILRSDKSWTTRRLLIFQEPSE